MKKILYSLLFFCTVARVYAQDFLPLYPSNPDSLGYLLCQSVNLDYPGLEEVKRVADQKKYAEALDLWRDYKVIFLRKQDQGKYNWHNNQLNGSSILPYAHYMVGTMSLKEFENSRVSFRKEFPLLGITQGVNNSDRIKWLAKDERGEYPQMIAHFTNFYPLTSYYYQSGDSRYLKKFFQVTGDFVCYQKTMVSALSSEEQKKNHCNWTTHAPSALAQCDRVMNIIRALGVSAKSLPGGGKSSKWDDVHLPVDKSLPNSSLKLIPSVELAQIALSLVLDHPQALMDRFIPVGAVPNQRRSGLTALVMIATQFPEFKLSKGVLDQASVGIDSYLNGAFQKDGAMLEQSFNYNMGDAHELDFMIGLLNRDYPQIANKIREKQIAFHRFSTSIRTPLGELPAMSSQSPGNPPMVWRDKNLLAGYLDKNYQSISGKTDSIVDHIALQFNPRVMVSPPDFTSVRFPYSGYYVQRKEWFWESPYLFFQDMRPARGHKNMGHNAIQVYAYGRPLLVSCGAPVYTVNQLPESERSDFDAINQLLIEESTLKLNTIMVDGCDQIKGKDAQEAYPDPIDRRWLTSEAFDFLEGVYDRGYPRAGTVEHRRQIIFVREYNFWIVVDLMNNVDKTKHSFRQIWNFPGFYAGDDPKKKAYGFAQNELSIRDNVISTTDPLGPNISLIHFSAQSLKYSSFFGQRNPYRGWFAPGIGSIVPAHQVFAEWESDNHSVVITVLYPINIQTPPELIRFNNQSNTTEPNYAAFTLEMKDRTKISYRAAFPSRIMRTPWGDYSAEGVLILQDEKSNTAGLIVGDENNKPFVKSFLR